MKREKEVPQELLAYLEQHRNQVKKVFNTLNIFCSIPIRAVRMRIFRDTKDNQKFCTVIIPAVDVYTTDKAVLKAGFLKRDALSYFIGGTHHVFPYGHIYASSGYVCLGNIFVPSAVPERAATMPIETLFLHNDRNLGHGNSHLFITSDQYKAIISVIIKNNIALSKLGSNVKPGIDIIQNDEIWNLSADVADQKPLPAALSIMSDIYDIIFKEQPNESEEQKNE